MSHGSGQKHLHDDVRTTCSANCVDFTGDGTLSSPHVRIYGPSTRLVQWHAVRTGKTKVLTPASQAEVKAACWMVWTHSSFRAPAEGTRSGRLPGCRPAASAGEGRGVDSLPLLWTCQGCLECDRVTTSSNNGHVAGMRAALYSTWCIGASLGVSVSLWPEKIAAWRLAAVPGRSLPPLSAAHVPQASVVLALHWLLPLCRHVLRRTRDSRPESVTA